MSDEEQSDTEFQVEREDSPPPPVEKVEKKPYAPPPEHHFGEEAGPSEAQLRMEAAMKKRREQADEEWAEYEEVRKAERDKLEEEIRELRERRERRKQERAEEEKRLNELRAAEEQKRRAEEEERQRKKREEEDQKREEREKKRKEAEERSKVGGPNFTIVKKDGVPAAGGNENQQEGGVPQKSKEQLEAEKRAALEQRIKPLSIDGLGTAQLQEKAKELFERLKKLESDKYDYIKRFEQQNFDMMELTEKARQMNKGGKKSNVQSQQNDPLASKMSGIPAKIVMYSLYERVTDPRGFGERRECYSGPSYKEEWIRVEPQNKIEMTEMGAKIVGTLDGAPISNNAEITVEE